MAVTTLKELREHLELAIAVELSTVPPYLYAMYSIDDQASEAALLIRSVVAEEMLHAALAANMLLAVGGDPDFSSTAMMPSYPSNLSHHRPPLRMNLAPCTRHQVEELFLVIERPETHHTIPEDDVYESLGQFYHAIERGMAAIATSIDVFADPQPNRQMATHSYYAPVTFDAEDSGGLGLIDSIEAANEAIHVIIHQGEGVSDAKWADPSHQELTHYYKFLRIARGEAPIGELLPVPTNPRGGDYPPQVKAVSDLFNAAYRHLYLLLHDIFQEDADRDSLVDDLYALMSGVLSPVGRYLVTMPFQDGVAAPTFEIYDFGDAEPRKHLEQLAADVAGDIAALAGVADTIAAL